MIKRLIRRFSGKEKEIDYIELILRVIGDPATYIRNLSSTSYSYIFEIETYEQCILSKCKMYNIIIDKIMPTHMVLSDKGKIIYTYGPNETQLMLTILKDFIN